MIPLNICPIIPKSEIKKRKGMKTQIVVRFPEITEVMTSCVPIAAAVFGSVPLFL